jgi:lipoprotein-anchoring transpeptidase ErfK/SrfK
MSDNGSSILRSVLLGLVIAAAGLGVLAWTSFGGGSGEAAAEAADALAADSEAAAPAGVGTLTSATEAPPSGPAIATEPAPEPEPERRIVVSTRRRMLWLVEGGDTLLRAPVAIGMNAGFEYNGRKWHFETPTGRRRVLAKSPDPIWTPPDWHYFEKATKKGLEAIRLTKGDTVELADGTHLVATDSAVGRINQFGYFAAFTPGVEIIFDGRIYIPPIDSPQRRVPDALGPYKLDMGDGYLIHGTHYYNEESIGEAVSHGCVRMNNDDLTRLYRMVPRGTVVEII